MEEAREKAVKIQEHNQRDHLNAGKRVRFLYLSGKENDR